MDGRASQKVTKLIRGGYTYTTGGALVNDAVVGPNVVKLAEENMSGGEGVASCALGDTPSLRISR